MQLHKVSFPFLSKLLTIFPTVAFAMWAGDFLPGMLNSNKNNDTISVVQFTKHALPGDVQFHSDTLTHHPL